MRRSDNRTVLTDEVARFQTEVRCLALAIISEVLRHELDRKQAKLPAARKPAKPPAARKPAKPPAARRRAKPPAPSEIVDAPVEQPSPTPAVPAVEATHEQPQPAEPPPAGSKKRVPWTRETIVSELATWMLSGTAIDATFVARHGPPGLVAATRRVFGRFEAALNVAALHISKLYPDGPPERGPT
jgi:hypothetical protein